MALTEKTSADGRLVALVTGGNGGIGVEICRGLAAQNVVVLMGCRSVPAGEAAAREMPSVEVVQLDVTDQQSVDTAAAGIRQRHGRLDILINCAGLAIAPGQSWEGLLKPSKITPEEMLPAYELNVLGIVRATNAFLPLLQQAPASRVVNVSSNRGSMATLTRDMQQGGPGTFLPYGCSKAAVSALTVLYAKELREAGSRVKVNAVCPGYCKTAFNGHRGLRDPADGAQVAIKMALLTDPDGSTGAFVDNAGTEPW